jgi:hypothetical protein
MHVWISLSVILTARYKTKSLDEIVSELVERTDGHAWFDRDIDLEQVVDIGDGVLGTVG